MTLVLILSVMRYVLGGLCSCCGWSGWWEV